MQELVLSAIALGLVLDLRSVGLYDLDLGIESPNLLSQKCTGSKSANQKNSLPKVSPHNKYDSYTKAADLNTIMGSAPISLKPCLMDLILHQDGNLLGYRVEYIQHVLSVGVG